MSENHIADAYLREAGDSLAGAESECANRRFSNCANRTYYAAFQAAGRAVAARIRPGHSVGRGQFLMTSESPLLLTPRMEAAIEEMKHLVTQRFPDATFELGHGEDPEGLHLVATVDLDDMGEVDDLYLDRLIEMQLDDALPLYVIPVRPVERSLAILAREQTADSWFRGP